MLVEEETIFHFWEQPYSQIFLLKNIYGSNVYNLTALARWQEMKNTIYLLLVYCIVFPFLPAVQNSWDLVWGCSLNWMGCPILNPSALFFKIRKHTKQNQHTKHSCIKKVEGGAKKKVIRYIVTIQRRASTIWQLLCRDFYNVIFNSYKIPLYTIFIHILQIWVWSSEIKLLEQGRTASVPLCQGFALHLSNAKHSSCRDIKATSQLTNFLMGLHCEHLCYKEVQDRRHKLPLPSRQLTSSRSVQPVALGPHTA